MIVTQRFRAPSVCPVCGGAYEITKLVCKTCGSELNGRFDGCPFCALAPADRDFALAFIQCRGNIREVEKELGISYPTVRNRLEGLISRLGLADKGDAEAADAERKDIIRRLEEGEISAQEAAEQLGKVR